MSAADTARLLSTLDLDDSRFQRGVSRSLSSLGRLDKGMGRVGKGVGQLGGGLLKVGAVAAGAAAAGLGIAAKKAIDMDDAFAGVVKTVGDASSGELQQLNDQLHKLATRIPVKYTDLAGIAAEAGALGVARQDIVGFTDTVARLSAATQGLSTEQAAEAFGKFKNSLQLSEKQIEQSASALIALGNAGASSEGDIIEIGKRFAGAGRTAGLTAAQVLGLSSAIASVGVQPEAAGGSLSRLFNNINKYIGTGDKKLQAFAKTTGQTVKGFAKGFEKDALGSFEAFLKGIAKLSGPEQAKRLKEAGVVNVRDISAIQLLAHSYGEVKRQTDLATDAFNKNTELTDVSTKRFDTLRNKLTVLGNNFTEAGYQISQGFLPAVGRAADKMTAFLQDPKNIATLRSIGDDIGKAIDKIDFDKLLRSAQGLAKAFDPALQVLLKIVDLISSLPPEAVGVGGGLLVANKISGGAITSGLGNIIGGLGETLARSLASQIPLFGRAFVQPVYVTNPGFGTGGIGGGGAAGALEAAGGGIAPALAPMTLRALLGTAGIGLIAGEIGTAVEHGITDTLVGLGIGTQQGAQQARDQTFLGLFDKLNNLPQSIAGIGDGLGQLNDFLNRPHPDFLGDLGKLLAADYHPDRTPGQDQTGLVKHRLGGEAVSNQMPVGEHARITVHSPELDKMVTNGRQLLAALHNANREGKTEQANRLREHASKLIQKINSAATEAKSGVSKVTQKEQASIAAEDRIHAAAERGVGATNSASNSITAAIRSAVPIITTVVNITATGVQAVSTTSDRYGSSNGSRGSTNDKGKG